MVQKAAAPGVGRSGRATSQTGLGKRGRRTVTRLCRLCEHVVHSDAVYCYGCSRTLIRERLKSLEAQAGRQADWLGGRS